MNKASLVRTLEDTPFYARSLVSTSPSWSSVSSRCMKAFFGSACQSRGAYAAVSHAALGQSQGASWLGEL